MRLCSCAVVAMPSAGETNTSGNPAGASLLGEREDHIRTAANSSPGGFSGGSNELPEYAASIRVSEHRRAGGGGSICSATPATSELPALCYPPQRFAPEAPAQPQCLVLLPGSTGAFAPQAGSLGMTHVLHFLPLESRAPGHS